ncbi:MAG: exodeoxyribonuclease III [Proteobacteria bacterium]|nr:exodeoxyribonuclease III [Pseudomonadota bacterium]
MKVITCNVNGIRSATSKGIWAWLVEQGADFICLQEVRAKLEDLPEEASALEGYEAHFHLAERPGYSGVAVYARGKPENITTDMGLPSLESEGRYLQLDYPDLSIISIYFPSGSASPERQYIKYDMLDHLTHKLEGFRRSKRHFIICGDWNIAHREIDLKNWRGNKKNSGFLPLERAWMDSVLGRLGYVDAFRVVNQEADQYTWWSNRGAAYENNVGWRIDYQVISPELAPKVRSAEIYTKARFSDHAPLVVEYDLKRI